MTGDTIDSALAAALTDPSIDGQSLLVAFSGGLDSSVLLHRLSTHRPAAVRAIHIHHGLHADADRWAEHCRDFCARLGVALTIVRVHVTPGGEGLEAAARNARYAAFAAALREGECLVTAHHQDDQAETVLLRLLRGSGAGGLAAMRTLRPFAGGRHWRPLLATPRSVLLDYGQRHHLQWLEDPSNASERHDRNFLRHRVLPILHERWPQAGAALARSAVLLSETEALLEEQTDQRLAQVQGVDPNALSVSGLRRFSTAWRALILRRWIAVLNFPPLPASGIEKIEQELLFARPDASAAFRWHGAIIHRWRDLLYVERPVPDLPDGWTATWDSATALPLPTGATLTLSTAQVDARTNPPPNEVFRVAARAGGERILLPGRVHSHALKNALLESGIPPWQRKRLPLVFAADGELLAVGDLLLSTRARAAGWRFRLDNATGSIAIRP